MPTMAVEVFRPVALMKNLPLTIECVAANNDCIIIATKQGHILRYKISSRRGTQSSQEFDVQLIVSNKKFSKKPVTQIEIVPELRILIVLSDNIIYVNNLDDLSTKQIIQKTKGATYFVINPQSQRTLTGEDQFMLRMCVVVKKKLMLFYWKNKNFHEMSSDITTYDQAKIVAWCSESLIVGYKSEYCLISLTGESKDLFPTGGKQIEPLVRLLSENRLAVSRDMNTYILDKDGNPSLNYEIKWSDIPIDIIFDSPYLIAILPSSIIEVRTIEPRVFIQRIGLAQQVTNSNKVRSMVKCNNVTGLAIAASASDLFAIVATSVQQQINLMVNSKQFELAIQLANMNEPTSGSVPALIEENKTNAGGDDEQSSSGISTTSGVIDRQKLEIQLAFDLFCKRRFKEAMDLYFKLDIDPFHVIGLYPDLLSDKYPTSHMEYPSRPPKLEETDLKEGLSALSQYLIQVRNKIIVQFSAVTSNVQSPKSISDSSDDTQLSKFMKSPKFLTQLRQIVDTTLLKCYLQTNDALVAPLIRLPDSCCHLEETEIVLKKHHKYHELIILYKIKGLHRKALDLLLDQSASSGHYATVQYLQQLGQEHFEIISRYSSWVLREHPEDGLKIFTADLPEAEQLDRSSVLEYLQNTAPSLVIPYLEHIIYIWNDNSTLFHNTLVLKYRQKVANLLAEYVDSLHGEQPAPAGKEPGQLGVLRSRLINFLENSEYYSKDGLPTYLLNEGLFEERAVVVGKLGNHEEALIIFIYALSDTKRAEEYCQSVYERKLPNSEDIFLILLRLYLRPSDSLSSIFKRNRSLASSSQNPSGHLCADMDSVVRLLNEHSDKIDPLKALKELPDTMNVSYIRGYISATFKRKLKERHDKEMFRHLVMAKFYQVQKSWIKLQQANKIVVDEQTSCQFCTKKIGKSAFVRFPNSDLVHYSCRGSYGRTARAQQTSILG